MTIDAPQLQAIGFDVSLPHDLQAARDKVGRQVSRAAYVALEQDGPAWAEREAQARAAATEQQEQRLEREANLEEALSGASRLVPLEAGPDPAALRARHPDRSRVIILPAVVRTTLEVSDGATRCDAPDCRVEGWVEVRVDEVNVPRSLQAALPRAALQEHRPRWSTNLTHPPRYRIVLRVGRRLKPYISRDPAGAAEE
ncbi:MAG: DUF4824 family protein [Anaeromyxobacter sp.]